MKRLFKNPVFAREFMVLAKDWKACFAAFSLVVLPAFILALLWPRSGVFSELNTNEIYTVFLTAELGLVMLLVPAFTAAAVTMERERGSLDLLFTSALRPWEILMGKLLAPVFTVFLILLLALPVMAMCALSGGISVILLAKTFSVIILAAIVYGLLSLMISAICRRTFTAVVIAYAAIGILAGASWLPSALLRQFVSLQPVWHVLRSLSPFEAMFALSQPERYQLATESALAASTPELYGMGMGILGFLSIIGFCFFMIHPLPARKSGGDQQYSDTRTAMKRRLGFPFYLIDPRRRKKPIANWRNPVFAVELRNKLLGKPKFIIRMLTVCVALSLLILILASFQFALVFGPEQVRLVAVAFQFGIVVLIAPIVSSGSITEERSTGTLLLLRMTPLSAWTAIVGKLKAALIYVIIFIISSIPVLYALTYLETDADYWRVASWCGVLLLSALAYIMTGLFCSTFMKSTSAATAMSYTIVFALSAVTFSVLAFGARIPETVKAIILTLNPLAAALQVTSNKWFAELPDIAGNRMWLNHVYLYSALVIIFLLFSVVRMHRLLKKRY
ncbi:MAG: ABC transporter permease [Verrucomicrobiota bacterium]